MTTTALLMILLMTTAPYQLLDPSSATAQAATHGSWLKRGDIPWGVMVEKVKSDSLLGKAGLLAGDILIALEREGVRLPIDSPFDWEMVDLEGQRGKSHLLVQRSGKLLELEVKPGIWTVSLRPVAVIEPFEETSTRADLFDTGRRDEGAAICALNSDRLHDSQPSELAAWGHLQAANNWVDAREWDRAREEYDASLRLASRPQAVVQVWIAIGNMAEVRDEFLDAESAYSTALSVAESAWGKCLLAGKIKHHLSSVAFQRGRLDALESYTQGALAIYQDLAPESLLVANALTGLGTSAALRGKFELAIQYFEGALAIQAKQAPNGTLIAQTLNNLGIISFDRGDLKKAEEYLLQSLSIRESKSPRSLDVAASLNNLGGLAAKRDDLDSAEQFYQRALAIWQSSSPNGVDAAMTLRNLGDIAQKRGDFDKAVSYYRTAVEIHGRLAPDSLDVAADLNNLGIIAELRGDFELAEDYLSQALLIRQKMAPDSLHVAAGLANLGLLAYRRSDLEFAEDYFQRALAIWLKTAPEGMDTAKCLDNLGNLARAQGDLASAREYYEKALKLRLKAAPGSMEVAASFSSLGRLDVQIGHLENGIRHFRNALRIRDSIAPHGADTAALLTHLGSALLSAGNIREAEKFLLRSLAIKESRVPGTAGLASTQSTLGQAYAALKEDAKARHYFQASLNTLESQIGRLGSSEEGRTAFRAFYQSYYREYFKFLIDRGEKEEAFLLLERFRARELIALLTERDLISEAEISPGLAARRRRIEASYDQVQQKIADSSAKDDTPEVERLSQKMRELRNEYNNIIETIRRTSPRLAALQYPEPLDSLRTREILDDGTILLSYAVDNEKTYLFVVTRDQPLRLEVLGIGREALEREIHQLRRLIQAHPSGLRGAREAAMKAASESLYTRLVAPVATKLQESKRIFILPDGPLHILPWGALAYVNPQELGGRGWQYLAEFKPIYVTTSATLFQELKNSRPRIGESVPQKNLLVAFGDPLYPKHDAKVEKIPELRIRSLVRQGFSFEPLPATRDEVEQIAALYPGDAKILLGLDAREETAKQVSTEARYIHFAAHSTLDERNPLNSAIALTIPEQFEEDKDNGLLQAWEIFEHVRLSADLVVLSACESGLGKEMGGEGLIGLTRAFQYAGAHSVMASLWKISDRTTAELMVRFYRHLKEGKPKDEALRAAQMELIRGPIQVTNEKGEVEEIDASAPYYWAAFQIYGDWQ